MRECRTSGSVGAAGGQLPAATRPALAIDISGFDQTLTAHSDRPALRRPSTSRSESATRDRLDPREQHPRTGER